ncbi:hypothetical protein AALP_AA5G103400 [Arabis alpina]|uniref:Uncharacterized protein n=1 Tax=Arabis alpina TaxID=50452 RepID=A0A087GW61_ARAAL|nr:hypothetical protein AALP_AA5G103400 [Arabis alpina]
MLMRINYFIIFFFLGFLILDMCDDVFFLGIGTWEVKRKKKEKKTTKMKMNHHHHHHHDVGN